MRNVDDFLRKGYDDDLVMKKDIIEKFQCEKDLQLHDRCYGGEHLNILNQTLAVRRCMFDSVSIHYSYFDA